MIGFEFYFYDRYEISMSISKHLKYISKGVHNYQIFK